ncbi:hypothetical protein NC653_033565 [Populus alba x Populus x berolinensis]|nr:hypothetical protein NC653_033565 [Populus alba x Populus x berolinensis]
MMMSQGGEYLRLFVPLSKSVLEKLLRTIAVGGRMDEGLRLRKTKENTSMGSKAPSWADQWGSGSFSKEDDEKFMAKIGHNNGNASKKMAEVKAAASTGLDKAKTAAQKVKSGTSVGIKWVKNQYQKKTSK